MTHVMVCMTCRAEGAPEGEERPGARLYRALEARVGACASPVTLQPVECMAVCKRPCTVAVSAPGKWTYIIGDLDAQADVEALLEYAGAYAASPSGTPPLKERPTAIRRGTVARIPPRA